MPNWCKNILTVHGPPEALADFVVATADSSAAGSGTLSFEALVPVQRESSNTWNTQAPEDPWETHYRHWGTKWEPIDVTLDLSPGEARYCFLTAWSPPLQWLRTVSERNPALLFYLSHSEPDTGQSGTMVLHDGVEWQL